MKQPNLIFVFADQWRRQALGHEGDPNARTPRLDAFAARSVRFSNAVSGCPVCSPYRASLMTGQYPLTHGMVVNDQSIRRGAVSFADALNAAGYHTAYIGKWHIDGHGRSRFVPRERRLGFQQWLGYECTHLYQDSPYYDDSPEPKTWRGYDAEAQTAAAIDHMRKRAGAGGPFALFMSWGPPHDPYDTAPERFKRMYKPDGITLRMNVPQEEREKSRGTLAGYYAHCAALDECFGTLLDEMERLDLAENTITVFTSDHGDMHGSHGLWKKQWPYEESIGVPFLLRWPAQLPSALKTVDHLFDAPDIMPTLLGLCGIRQPGTVEGCDLSRLLTGQGELDDNAALLSCYFPFHECSYMAGARDYRGVRTARHTYVRSHEGPWLLFDNQEDPFQMRNLAGDPDSGELRNELDASLTEMLRLRHDRFEQGIDILRRLNVRMSPTDHGDDVHVEW